MSDSSQRPVSGVLMLIVLAVTAVLGWMLGAPSQTSGKEVTAGPASKSERDSPWARRKELRAGARGQVDRISAGKTPEERLRRTIELATTLSPSQFGEWVDGGWFNYRDGFELTLFRKIVEERWRKEDPEGFVEWCLGGSRKGSYHRPKWMAGTPHDEAIAILADWSVNDPDRLNAYLAKNPDEQLEGRLLANLASKDPALAALRLEELLEGGLSQAVRNNLSGVVDALAAKSPEAMERLLDRLPQALRFQAESSLAREGLKTSFEEEIRKLWARSDGWKLFSNNLHRVEGLGGKLLEELPNLPASWRKQMVSHGMHAMMYNQETEPWIHADLEGAGFTEDQADRIRQAALSRMIRGKPERALELLGQLDFGEEVRVGFIQNLFRSVRSKPDQAAELLAQLGSEGDRVAARAILDEPARQPTTRREYKTPDDWIAAVSGEGGNDSMQSYYLTSALRNWDRKQISELTGRYREMPAEQKLAAAELFNSGGYSAVDVAPDLSGEMVRTLIEAAESGGDDARNRSVRNATRLASSTAVNWVVKDPAAASEWVDGLPDGEAKLWARKNMAATWAEYDPDAVESWIGSLDADTGEEVRAFLEDPQAK